MKYYLSGAITSQSDFKKYFSRYETQLRAMGITDIFNPAAKDWPEYVRWDVCMKYDIKILADCDCLILLPNWKKSRGAKVETYLCKKLGIRVVKYHNFIKELIHAS